MNDPTDRKETAMKFFARIVFAIPLLLLPLSACKGGSGPTAPPDAATLSVNSQAGQLTVLDYGCGNSLDLARIASELDTTMRIASRQNPAQFGAGGTLNGFQVAAHPTSGAQQRCNGAPACFETLGNSGRLHVWCDGGGVEHETAHALAWAVRLPCWEVVYHSDNFRCERTSDMYGG